MWKNRHTGIKIATVPAEDRREKCRLQISSTTGKLSCWSWNFPCKCSSALLNITAPAQKGFELQNNLYLFLNIQNLLPSLSYDLLSDFSMLSTVKRAFSNNVPPQNYLSPRGAKSYFSRWQLYKFGRTSPRLGLRGGWSEITRESTATLLRVNELQKIGPVN